MLWQGANGITTRLGLVPPSAVAQRHNSIRGSPTSQVASAAAARLSDSAEVELLVGNAQPASQPQAGESRGGCDQPHRSKVRQPAVGRLLNNEAAEIGADAGRYVLQRRVGTHEPATPLASYAGGDHGHGRDHAAGIAHHQE